MKKTLLIIAVFVFSASQMWSQGTDVPQIGSKAPSFNAQTTNGKLSFPSDYGDSWKILFSHPKDFTPVCSSEILELAHAQDAFKALNTEIVVLSTDLLEQHESWKAAIEEITYKDRAPVKIDFPLVSDNDLKVSTKYGMIHSASSVSQNIRGVYIINPDNKIRAIYFYPNEVGRNIEEVKRTLVALQTTYAASNLVTPANWEKGDDVIVPVLSQEDRKNIGTPGSEYYEVAWFMVFKNQ